MVRLDRYNSYQKYIKTTRDKDEYEHTFELSNKVSKYPFTNFGLWYYSEEEGIPSCKELELYGFKKTTRTTNGSCCLYYCYRETTLDKYTKIVTIRCNEESPNIHIGLTSGIMSYIERIFMINGTVLILLGLMIVFLIIYLFASIA